MNCKTVREAEDGGRPQASCNSEMMLVEEFSSAGEPVSMSQYGGDFSVWMAVTAESQEMLS